MKVIQHTEKLINIVTKEIDTNQIRQKRHNNSSNAIYGIVQVCRNKTAWTFQLYSQNLHKFHMF